MEYIKVRWIHFFTDAPILLYSELDKQRWELRKVEIFGDGHMGYSDGKDDSTTTGLGEEPIPNLTDITADPQFQAEVISKAEFDAIWEKAIKDCSKH
jgi:hypothetical protein